MERSARVALVTGATSGIGRSCAEHLQQRGWRVYGAGRSAPPADSSPPDDGACDRPILIATDVDDDTSVRSAVEFVVQREGRLDAVVNNAGFAAAGAIEETSLEEARAQFETNFFGVMRVCRAALPHMRRQGSGCIVNVASVAGRIGIPFHGLYSASKFALEGMTEALRIEVRPFGIRVTLVEPGSFRTQTTSNRRVAAAAGAESHYGERGRRAVSVMERDERAAGPPDRVARLVGEILENPRPAVRYTVGPVPERVAVALKSVLPARIFERALERYFCGGASG